MGQITYIQNTSLAPRPKSLAGAAPAVSRGYEGAGDVQTRASTAPHRLSVQELAGLIRLDKIIAKEVPPRTDVPRGYYLDIRV